MMTLQTYLLAFSSLAVGIVATAWFCRDMLVNAIALQRYALAVAEDDETPAEPVVSLRIGDAFQRLRERMQHQADETPPDWAPGELPTAWNGGTQFMPVVRPPLRQRRSLLARGRFTGQGTPKPPTPPIPTPLDLEKRLILSRFTACFDQDHRFRADWLSGVRS